MIKQLSRFFSHVNVAKTVSSDAELEALRTTQKLLRENLTSMDTFVKTEMPQIKQSTAKGLDAIQKLSESSKSLLPK